MIFLSLWSKWLNSLFVMEYIPSFLVDFVESHVVLIFKWNQTLRLSLPSLPPVFVLWQVHTCSFWVTCQWREAWYSIQNEVSSISVCLHCTCVYCMSNCNTLKVELCVMCVCMPAVWIFVISIYPGSHCAWFQPLGVRAGLCLPSYSSLMMYSPTPRM